MTSRFAFALFWIVLCAPSVDRDTPVHLSLADVVEKGVADGHLDGTVRFFLEGQRMPAVLDTFGEATSTRKTNAFGKSDAKACRWVALSALIALQNEARARGANAVISLSSHFKRRSFTDSEKFECNAGALMAGVAFRGTYAKLAAQ